MIYASYRFFFGYTYGLNLSRDDFILWKVRFWFLNGVLDGEKADLSVDKYPNINVITGALKLYLRILPVPLITFEIHPLLIDAIRKYKSRWIYHSNKFIEFIYWLYKNGIENLIFFQNLTLGHVKICFSKKKHIFTLYVMPVENFQYSQRLLNTLTLNCLITRQM